MITFCGYPMSDLMDGGCWDQGGLFIRFSILYFNSPCYKIATSQAFYSWIFFSVNKLLEFFSFDPSILFIGNGKSYLTY